MQMQKCDDLKQMQQCDILISLRTVYNLQHGGTGYSWHAGIRNTVVPLF